MSVTQLKCHNTERPSVRLSVCCL